MGVYTEGDKHYSGAGVLIVEDYYMKDGEVVPCIILVKNKASGEYSDFGGSYEKKHISLKETASKELQEESRNLFVIDPKFMTNYVDIPAFSNNFYRVYLLKINGANRKYFLHNKNLIDTAHQNDTHVPRSWRETSDIAHIPIKNIDYDKLAVRGKITVQDINGKDIIFSGRIKKIIRNTKLYIEKLVNENPIAKRNNIVIHKTELDFDKSESWTNMTYSYVLN